MSEEEECCGAGACFKPLRAYKGQASRSQRLTERVHDIKSVSSCSEVLARMEIWKAALKEHVKDAGCEVADVTVASGLRRLVPTDFSAELHKNLHIVRYSDVKYIIFQVCLRLCYDKEAAKE